jgi:hypothetical protein
MSRYRYPHPGKRLRFSDENRILGLIFYNFYECKNQFEQITPVLSESVDDDVNWSNFFSPIDYLNSRFYVLWEFNKVVYECSYKQIIDLLNDLINPLIGQGQDIIITQTTINNSDLFCFDHDGGIVIYKRKINDFIK